MLGDQQGQTFTEYMMVLGQLTAMVLVIFVGMFAPAVRTAVQDWTDWIVCATNVTGTVCGPGGGGPAAPAPAPPPLPPVIQGTQSAGGFGFRFTYSATDPQGLGVTWGFGPRHSCGFVTMTPGPGTGQVVFTGSPPASGRGACILQFQACNTRGACTSYVAGIRWPGRGGSPWEFVSVP